MRHQDDGRSGGATMGQIQRKALLLPFMQIPSGHHHVADTLMAELRRCNMELSCTKVDLLSYSYGWMEKLISSIYLTWIKKLPSTYNWLYYQAAYKKTSQHNRNFLYEMLFIYFFKQLVKEKKPNILFCTHALPSHIASVLKQKKQLDSIVVNIYTDFFVNRVWGLEGIDFHFVPSIQVKEYLLKKGIQGSNIFVTGIPVNSVFLEQGAQRRHHPKPSILVTGGNLGIGTMEKYLTNTSGSVHFYVLCGKNQTLYRRLSNQHNSHITPFPYLSCRKKMNDLYDRVDAVLTKPGGVTISECLIKRKPIFVCNPLPGQEKINVEQLKQLGVIMPVNVEEQSFEQKIIQFFNDRQQQTIYQQKMEEYHQNLECQSLSKIIEGLLERIH